MIITVVVITNGVEVDGNYIPRVVAVARQVELAGDYATYLGSRASIAPTDMVANIRVKVRPVVESRNRTQGFLDALMTVEIVVSVKSPSVEARGQDNV